MLTPGEAVQALSRLGVATATEPVPVSGGWSGAGLWKVELPERFCLLRVYSAAGEAGARREARLLDHLEQFEFPAQRVVACGVAAQAMLLLVTWLDGRGLEVELLNGGDPRELGAAFGKLQAWLHQLEVPEGLPDALTWPAAEAYPEALLQLLEREAATDRRIVHLDFHPANVLVDGGGLSGLIDWTNARAGDPRFDIARTYLLLRLLPGLGPQLKARYLPAQRHFISAWHTAYRREAGAVSGIAPFLAWAGYGLIYDLERKPAESLSPAAAAELARVFEWLSGRLDRWMAGTGLDPGVVDASMKGVR